MIVFCFFSTDAVDDEPPVTTPMYVRPARTQGRRRQTTIITLPPVTPSVSVTEVSPCVAAGAAPRQSPDATAVLQDTAPTPIPPAYDTDGVSCLITAGTAPAEAANPLSSSPGFSPRDAVIAPVEANQIVSIGLLPNPDFAAQQRRHLT